MTDNQDLHVGSVFQVSMRNVNLKGRSTKGGMIYRFEAEITEDDFDLFRGHDLTGSCFESAVECTAIADSTSGEAVNAGSSPAPETKPYGKQASELYRSGFFYVPAVLEAIGTDAEFLDWIRAQPCAVTGERDYHKDEATGVVTERCDPAHVRTVANGAGTAIKPPYCAIPLVHQLHDIETKHGKAALYLSANVGYEAMPQNVLERAASEWMDKQRNEYVVAWASKTLAAHFKQLSMGFVPPTDMRLWAKEHGVEHYLPAAYK